MTAPVHANIDLRGQLNAVVQNQGDRPTCAPFAVTAGHEAHRGMPIVPLAPEALWQACCLRGETSNEGVYLHDVGAALARAGQPELRVWPYDNSLGPATESAPQASVNAPWFTAQLVEVQICRDGLELPIETELVNGRPVIISIEVFDDFYVPLPGGWLTTPDLNDPGLGFHAVLIVGAYSAPTGERYLCIKNSWGQEWGSGGYGFLPIDYLISHGSLAYAVTSPN